MLAACDYAVDNDRCEDAKRSCEAVVTKEPTLAMAHYLLARCEAPQLSRKHLAETAALHASEGRDLSIRAHDKVARVRRVLDDLTVVVEERIRDIRAEGRSRERTLVETLKVGIMKLRRNFPGGHFGARQRTKGWVGPVVLGR